MDIPHQFLDRLVEQQQYQSTTNGSNHDKPEKVGQEGWIRLDGFVIKLARNASGNQVAKGDRHKPNTHHLTHQFFWGEFGDGTQSNRTQAKLAARVKKVGHDEPGG